MKCLNVSFKIISFLILVTLGFSTFAQDDDDMDSSDSATAATPAPKTKFIKKSKRTEVNFEDQLIKGEVQKPELFYLLQKKQFNFSKLIKLRENFLPEMKKTSEDVPRGVED